MKHLIISHSENLEVEPRETYASFTPVLILYSISLVISDICCLPASFLQIPFLLTCFEDPSLPERAACLHWPSSDAARSGSRCASKCILLAKRLLDRDISSFFITASRQCVTHRRIRNRCALLRERELTEEALTELQQEVESWAEGLHFPS